MRVHGVHHAAPGIDVFLVAGHEQRVVETHERARNSIPVFALAGHRIHRAEPPAVRILPPRALRAADSAVEPDVAGNDAAVLLHAIEPCVHVFDDPGLVPGLAADEVRVHRQRRGDQVEKVIADDITVFLVVGEELLERRFTVQGVETLDVEWIADPIERGRLSKHRPAAAVLHAADDLVHRIVVGSLRILAHVEARKPPRARLVLLIHRDRQAHAVEELQPFAVVHPIGLDDELLVVHALSRDRHLGRLRLGVLPEQALVTLGIHLENVVGRTERVQLGPAVEILECIVGSVVGAPAHDALEMTAIVEVLREELATRRHVLGEEPPFENCPTRRIHTGVDAEGYFHGAGPHAGHEQSATDDEHGCTATDCWMMHKP